MRIVYIDLKLFKPKLNTSIYQICFIWYYNSIIALNEKKNPKYFSQNKEKEKTSEIHNADHV